MSETNSNEEETMKSESGVDIQEPRGEVLGSFGTTEDDLRTLFKESTLDGYPRHDDLYLEIRPEDNGEVRILQSAPGEVVLSYCSFYPPYLDSIEVANDESLSIVFNIKAIQMGLEAINSDNDQYVRFEIRREKTNPDFHWIRLSGEQEPSVVPTYPYKQLEYIPQWLPGRFTARNVYTNKQREEAPTIIDTEVKEVEKIARGVRNHRTKEFYPIVVENGEFQFPGDGERVFPLAATVEGPDVENYYYDGFKEVLEVLDGRVKLQTAPMNNPMAVVQEEIGKVNRHVIGSIRP